MRIRVAAMFWGENQRSKLFLKDGANTAAYKTLLEEMLLPAYNPEDGLLFMQDNAPTHKAKTIKDLLAEKQITCLEWPPKSPDLNPLQYIWESLIAQAAKMSPQKWAIKGRSEEPSWKSTCASQIDDLQLRIKACTDAKGYWHVRLPLCAGFIINIHSPF